MMKSHQRWWPTRLTLISSLVEWVEKSVCLQRQILERLESFEHQQKETNNLVSLLVDAAIRQEETIMTSIQDLQAKADQTLSQVQSETDVLASVKAFVQGQNDQLASLQKQIEDLISNGSTSEQDLQKLSDTIDQIRTLNEQNTAAAAAAIVKDTPAEGTDPSVPVDGTTPTDGSGTVGDTGAVDENGNPVENNTIGGGTPVSTDPENPGMRRRR